MSSFNTRRVAGALLGVLLVLGATGCPTVGTSAGLPPGSTLVAAATGTSMLDALAFADDGSAVVYEAWDVYAPLEYYRVFDVPTGTTTEVGHLGITGGAASFFSAADLSADGRYMVFVSKDPALRPGVTAPNCRWSEGFLSPILDVPCFEIFLRDLETGTTVPVTGAAESSTVDNVFPRISADGRWVTYATKSSLVPESGSQTTIRRWDRETGTTEVLDPNADFESVVYSRTSRADGRFRFDFRGDPVAPHELPGDNDFDIYATDLLTDERDKITEDSVTGLSDVTSDGSQVLTLCEQPHPRTHCLLDRVTHERRNLAGHPDMNALVNGDATKLLSVHVGAGTIGFNLLIRSIEPVGG